MTEEAVRRQHALAMSCKQERGVLLKELLVYEDNHVSVTGACFNTEKFGLFCPAVSYMLLTWCLSNTFVQIKAKFVIL